LPHRARKRSIIRENGSINQQSISVWLMANVNQSAYRRNHQLNHVVIYQAWRRSGAGEGLSARRRWPLSAKGSMAYGAAGGVNSGASGSRRHGAHRHRHRHLAYSMAASWREKRQSAHQSDWRRHLGGRRRQQAAKRASGGMGVGGGHGAAWRISVAGSGAGGAAARPGSVSLSALLA